MGRTSGLDVAVVVSFVNVIVIVIATPTSCTSTVVLVNLDKVDHR